MIHFISGKPRGGKSYYSLKIVVNELLNGNRTIVTNLPIVPGELSAYLQEKHPEKSIDLHARLRLLDDDNARQFWLYRSRKKPEVEGTYGEWLVCPASEENGRTDYSESNGLPSVLYVIDEIHIYFNSREWQKTGKAAIWYLSQHGKLGDDVVCITQSINNVDKQFRSVAQDFTYVRNHAKEKFMGFRQPNIMTWKKYLQPANGLNDEVTERGTFQVDVTGLAKCYNTAQGVGIVGVGADIGQRTKGFSMAWLIVVAVVVVVGLWYAPEYLTKAVASTGAGKMLVGFPAATNGIVNSGIPGPVRAMVPPGYAMSPPETAPLKLAEPEPLGVVGIARLGDQVKIWLTDGQVLTEKTPGLEFISDNFIILRGQVVKYANRPAVEMPSVPRYAKSQRY